MSPPGTSLLLGLAAAAAVACWAGSAVAAGDAKAETAGSTPPLAGAPKVPAELAASPVGLDRLPSFDARRFRVGLGLSWSHRPLAAPGGSSLGIGASAALEGRWLELALALYVHGGFAAQDARARHTGVSTSYLRLTGRVAPFPAWLRVMLEAGGQVGWDPAWSWCVAAPPGEPFDRCGVVPSRVSWAAVGGVVTRLRLARWSLTLGLDALLKGPRPPRYCGPVGECQDSPLGSGMLGLQAWLEAGFGGVAR